MTAIWVQGFSLSNNKILKETDAVDHPIQFYASTKRSNELMAHAYSSLYKIPTTGLRFFTVYGPCGRPDMCMFRFAEWIEKEVPIELFGDGEQSRDFTYVDDIARGTIAAQRELGYEIINLGGGNNPVSINNIIKQIFLYNFKQLITNKYSN